MTELDKHDESWCLMTDDVFPLAAGDSAHSNSDLAPIALSQRHWGLKGRYWYSRGFNPLALIALVAGIAPCVPDFLGTIGAVKVAPVWISLYHYAWFLSFAISAVCCAVLDEARPE